MISHETLTASWKPWWTTSWNVQGRLDECRAKSAKSAKSSCPWHHVRMAHGRCIESMGSRRFRCFRWCQLGATAEPRIGPVPGDETSLLRDRFWDTVSILWPRLWLWGGLHAGASTATRWSLPCILLFRSLAGDTRGSSDLEENDAKLSTGSYGSNRSNGSNDYDIDEEAVIEVVNGQRYCRHPSRPGSWWQPWWCGEHLTRYSDWLAWPPLKEVRVCRRVPHTTSKTGETCFTVR